MRRSAPIAGTSSNRCWTSASTQIQRQAGRRFRSGTLVISRASTLSSWILLTGYALLSNRASRVLSTKHIPHSIDSNSCLSTFHSVWVLVNPADYSTIFVLSHCMLASDPASSVTGSRCGCTVCCLSTKSHRTSESEVVPHCERHRFIHRGYSAFIHMHCSRGSDYPTSDDASEFTRKALCFEPAPSNFFFSCFAFTSLFPSPLGTTLLTPLLHSLTHWTASSEPNLANAKRSIKPRFMMVDVEPAAGPLATKTKMAKLHGEINAPEVDPLLVSIQNSASLPLQYTNVITTGHLE